jgi:alpha-galactosidase
MTSAEAWLDRPVVSFRYDGQCSDALLSGWDRTETGGGAECRTTLHRDPETGLVAEVAQRRYADFPAVEWVAYLENTGPATTPLVERLLPLDVSLPLAEAAPCVVRYARGALCSVWDFEPQETALHPRSALHLQPGGGRSSSEFLPFANLIFGGGGLMLAIGWTGEWALDLSRGEDGALAIRAGMARTHLRLKPGERIRTPRILVVCYDGEPVRGHNFLRRLLLRHHRPLPDGAPLVPPLCNGNWGGTPAAVHLDNLRRIAEHNLPFEYYWIDAEWFGKPGHWMENAGDWTPRPDLYPQSLGPMGHAAHAAGRKLLLWFEPERVAPGTPWAQEHPEWLLTLPPEKAVTWADYGGHMAPEEWIRWESARNQLNAGDKLLNLGHPDARRFLTDFLSDRIAEWGIDCLRWDSNIAQLAYWREADAPDRQGITEIRYVEGQYALWDELLARHPGLIVDNCSSGGRRIDLETISRSTPLWRTDYTVGHQDPTATQCHTWGLLHWVPLNGTGGGYLDRMTAYDVRSRMCASLVVGLAGQGDACQEPIPEDYPWDHARRLLEDYLGIRRFFLGDYYPLTAYSRAPDAWMAYQLDLPEDGEGLLVVLKRTQSPYTRATFRLAALTPDHPYRFTNRDTGEETVRTGEVARSEGLEIELRGAPDSCLMTYARGG